MVARLRSSWKRTQNALLHYRGMQNDSISFTHGGEVDHLIFGVFLLCTSILHDMIVDGTTHRKGITILFRKLKLIINIYI